MFKSILPANGKRNPTVNGGQAPAEGPAQPKTASTKAGADGKENRPQGGGRAGKRPWSTINASNDDIRVLTTTNEREKLSERRAVNVAFEKMLVSWLFPRLCH